MAVTNVSSQKTIQDIIDQTASKTGTRNTGELGKDDFLNLLVTQLKYQDPLKPTEDKEFIGQMAQFSSLEQMQNMNSSLTNSQAFSLIGKHITASITDTKTSQTKAVEGDVTSVKVSGGKSYVVVNGEDILVDKITNVTESLRATNAASNIAGFTSLIGYKAQGAVYDSKTGEIVAVSGPVTSIAKGQYEDYAVMDGVTVQISGVVSDTTSADPNYLKNYLEEHTLKDNVSIDNTVNVYITDRSTGAKVPITATLKSYTVDPKTGNISAVLDQVFTPVDSIAKISPGT